MLVAGDDPLDLNDTWMESELGDLTESLQQLLRTRAKDASESRTDSGVWQWAERAAQVLTRLAAIVESTEDAVIGLSMRRRITFWNRGAELVFGYPSSEMVGQNMLRFVPEPRRAEAEQLFDKVERGERVVQYETQWSRCDGQPVHIALTMSPIVEDSEHIRGLSLTARNITEQRRADRSLQRAHAALRRKSKEMEEFLSIIAHDMKHPIVGIQGMLSLLKQDCYERLDEENRQNLDLALGECDRMKQMLALLSELGRIGRHTPQLETVNIRDLVQRCVDRFAATIDQRGIDLLIDVPDVPLSVAALYVEEALSNLLDNAIKYGCGANGGVIEVSSRIMPSTLEITVADHGPGIDPKHHERVFQPFRRDVGASSEPGSGIGLAAVRRMIQMLHGDVELQSQPGQGARFTLTIAID